MGGLRGYVDLAFARRGLVALLLSNLCIVSLLIYLFGNWLLGYFAVWRYGFLRIAYDAGCWLYFDVEVWLRVAEQF